MGTRYLIDSNTLIEFTSKLLPDLVYEKVSSIIDSGFYISFINRIEVLGHPAASVALQNFIDQAYVFDADSDIVEQTILIRKNHKIKIPDAIIAATAIVNDLTIVTRNIDDFKNISLLLVENPWSWS